MASARDDHTPPGDGETSAAADGVRSGAFVLGGEEFVFVSFPISTAQEPLDALTDAERDVVRLLLEGRSNEAIAASRASAPRTVANQLASIYRKLGVGSRSELVSLLAGGTRPAR